MLVSIFEKFNHVTEDLPMSSVLEQIRDGKHGIRIEYLRELLKTGNKDEYDKQKKSLPAFTPSATFKGGRTADCIDKYSGFIHLDLDKLSEDKLAKALSNVIQIPYTYACFTSPGNNGLKIFIRVSTDANQHDLCYKQVQTFYEQQIGHTFDPKCKDITRLCFYSHDPNLFYNPKSLVFENTSDFQSGQLPLSLDTENNSSIDGNETEMEDLYKVLFEECIRFTEQKENYYNGNRNNFIYLLASNCNRRGIPESIAFSFISAEYDLSHKEILESVKSAYKHHSSEFAKFANSAKSAKLQSNDQVSLNDDESIVDFLKGTPTIPDEIYDKLPAIFRTGSLAFTEKRKRDVFFTAAIAIMSGCLPKVTGIYFNERLYPHLYTFIIAPAASGKGVLKNAKRLANKYHEKVLAASLEQKSRYEAAMIFFKNSQKGKHNSDTSTEAPQKPPFKLVFIPADCSHARMIEHLQSNGGLGIICESEADTMSGAKKQDWGDYSPTLRAAFHHETITFTRKTNDEYIEINEPRLAVTLTGTPAQAPKLIASAEDGLFSRFLFYAFKGEIVWQDPSPNRQTIVYNDHFDSLSADVLNLIEFLEQSPTNIQLTPEQWVSLNDTFERILSEVSIFTGENAAAIVYRLGLITFRICMIFSSLRKFETGEMSETLFCTDLDFNSAITVARIYLEHSILMYDNLPKQGSSINFTYGDSKRKFYEALPGEFSRKQAIDLSTQFHLSARSVDDMLKLSVGVSLKKPKAGYYVKL